MIRFILDTKRSPNKEVNKIIKTIEINFGKEKL
jgi:hypothetical protein